MARFGCILAGLFACGIGLGAVAKGGSAGVVRQAAAVESAVAMRGRGPEGLDRALGEYDVLQAKITGLVEETNRLGGVNYDRNKEAILAIEKRIAELNGRLAEMKATIDQIGGQRGCSVSRLYWYTDLHEAKAAAERTGRPILSLRMLGKLTDEYSCANSRFFRTALYSNKEISDYLRENFILHWQSVRPVPKVTIDFGDGRKLERTLTGNSAHYVLASDGTPLDVLPGLYSPQRFLNWLNATRQLHGRYAAADISIRSKLLQRYHEVCRDAVLEQWDRDIQHLGEPSMTMVSTRVSGAIQASLRDAGQQAANGPAPPNAAQAARRAVGKSAAEAPLLRFANYGGPLLEKSMDDDLWQAIANLHRKDVRLDEASVNLMEREFPRAAVAGKLAITKSFQERPMLRMVRAFEDSMTLDTVRNEYLLHRRIHERFADDKTPPADLDALNEWVYAELFLTPSSDPWLGLAPRDVYTALDNDGRTEPTAQVAGRPGG